MIIGEYLFVVILTLCIFFAYMSIWYEKYKEDKKITIGKEYGRRI